MPHANCPRKDSRSLMRDATGTQWSDNTLVSDPQSSFFGDSIEIIQPEQLSWPTVLRFEDIGSRVSHPKFICAPRLRCRFRRGVSAFGANLPFSSALTRHCWI